MNAAFVIDGVGTFMLATDKCKPRFMKDSTEIESIIRRACSKSCLSNGQTQADFRAQKKYRTRMHCKRQQECMHC